MMTLKKKFILLFLVMSIFFLTKEIYFSTYVNINLKAYQGDRLQVFYDIGNSYNETDSKKVNIIPDGEFHLYKIKLPSKNINKLRIDPINSQGQFMISNISFQNKFNKVNIIGSNLNNTSNSNIEILENNGTIYNAHATNNDPIFIVEIPYNFTRIIPLLYKVIILVFLLILLHGLYVVRSLSFFKLFISKYNLFVDTITDRYIQKFNLEYRLDIYIFILLGIFFLLPTLLTGEYNIFPSFMSYARGASLTVAALIFSMIGWIFFKTFEQNYPTNVITSPIHNLFLGQVLVYIYIYIRSFLNEYVFYFPFSFIDFLFVFLIFILLLKKNNISIVQIIKEIQNNLPYLFLIYGMFFILMVGISEYELPRIFMLSSDPDQHVFFGKQIERFGTIPYHQFSWGSENFNYPAGTGVISYIWSSLTFLDIRDALAIQPFLQTTIAIFIAIEVITYKRKSLKAIFGIIITLFLLTTYLLPYPLVYFHLCGTGRFSSVSINAFMLSILLLSFLNKNTKGEIKPLLVFIFITLLILFYAITMHPINIIYTSFIVAFSFLLFSLKDKKYYPLLLMYFIFIFLLFLDPYYSNQILHGGNNNIVDTLQHKNFNLSIMAFSSEVLIEIKNNFLNPLSFFKFTIFNNIYVYISLLLALILLYLLTNKRLFSLFKYIFFSMLLLYLFWIPINAILNVLSRESTNLRLLYPYFSFSTFQYLYLFLLLLFSLVFSNIFHNKISFKNNLIWFIFFIVFIYIISNTYGNTPHVKRVDYNQELIQDDYLTIKEIEKIYQQTKYSKNAKILVLNQMMIMNGGEKWLFPVGAGRILPYYNVFPLAFYYFKGERYYSYDNYGKYVYNDFNTTWLDSKQIKYVFIPSKREGIDIKNINTLIDKNEVLIQHGNTYFIKLKHNKKDNR